MKARMTAVFLILFLGCGGEEGLSEIPEHLIGRWKTEDTRYKGCFLDLKKDSVTFVSAEGQKSVNSLKKVEISSEEDSRLYTLYYTGEDDRECTMKFYYESSGGRVIRLESRKQIEWTRKDS